MNRAIWLCGLLAVVAGCATTSKRNVKTGSPVPQSCSRFNQEIKTCSAKVKHKSLGVYLSQIARCETGNKCTGLIDSPNGLYHGPFQYASGTWNSLCKPFFEQHGLPSCAKESAMYDTCCAAMCAADMISKGGAHNWPVCGKREKNASASN